MKYLLLAILLTLQIFYCVSMSCDLQPKTTEAKLKKKLLCNYDKTERPVINHKNPVVVSLHLVLQNFDFSSSKQKIFINAWLLMAWTDEFLKWDHRDYDGIQKVVVSSDEIWNPDPALYSAYYSNSVDTACNNPKCLLDHNGTVFCVPACNYDALCHSDFTRWPFDVQKCDLRFGMWAESAAEIDWESNDTTIASNATNSHTEWKIVSAKVERTVDIFGPENKTYPTLTFNYVLERHSGAHAVVIITPALIMIIINLISCWIQASSAERVVLIGANMLGHFAYLQTFYWYIPYNGSSTPTVLLFFRDSLIISTLLLLVTVFLRAMLGKETEAPKWIITMTTSIISTNVGKYIFASDYLYFAKRKSEPVAAEDAVDLVETSPKMSQENLLWQQFGKLLDRLIFLVTFLTYTIMILLLIPEGYVKGDGYVLTISEFLKTDV